MPGAIQLQVKAEIVLLFESRYWD